MVVGEEGEKTGRAVVAAPLPERGFINSLSYCIYIKLPPTAAECDLLFSCQVPQTARSFICSVYIHSRENILSRDHGGNTSICSCRGAEGHVPDNGVPESPPPHKMT